LFPDKFQHGVEIYTKRPESFFMDSPIKLSVYKVLENTSILYYCSFKFEDFTRQAAVNALSMLLHNLLFRIFHDALLLDFLHENFGIKRRPEIQHLQWKKDGDNLSDEHIDNCCSAADVLAGDGAGFSF
jgi:hypothetical protein